MEIEALHDAEESQARLAAIVESSDDAIIGKTLDGVVTSWNHAAERLFGHSAEEAIGKSILLIVPADRHDEEQGILSRLRRGERVHSFETVRVAKDGTMLNVSVTASPIRDRTGKVIGASKIARNITDRMRAENEIKESQMRLQGIIGSAMDAIVTVDDQQRITLFNAAAERMFGCSASEVIGKSLDRFLPAQFRDMHREHIRIFGDTGVTTRAMNSQRPLTAVRSDGVEFPVEATISQVTVAGHKLYTALVRDISERKRAEVGMALQAEELARSNVELERFAFVASHDLQEPMRTVQSFAQLLQRGYGEVLAGEGAEYLQFITDGVKRMQTLINDLLTYSRIDSQGAAFAHADCNEICVMVLRNLQASIESNQAKITIEPLPVVIGDATQLGQMFQNLLVNAIKFHGGRTPCIHVSAKEASNEWIFSVTDNGIGIPSEHFDQIFIIFQRLHTIEEYGGTGIGLAICKKIAERHGGRIWVDSVVGEGSTFHFSILKREKTT